jgi:hypothetical protein
LAVDTCKILTRIPNHEAVSLVAKKKTEPSELKCHEFWVQLQGGDMAFKGLDMYASMLI